MRKYMPEMKMNKKIKEKNIDEHQYLDLKSRRGALLGSLKYTYPVGHKLAKWISEEDYFQNGWRSCLSSHMQLIIDQFPAADVNWLYLQLYKWVERMEGNHKLMGPIFYGHKISEDDKQWIYNLVKSYALSLK